MHQCSGVSGLGFGLRLLLWHNFKIKTLNFWHECSTSHNAG